MRVLFIIDNLGSGGKERRLVELLKGLSIKNDIAIKLVILSSRIHYKEIHDLDIDIKIIERKYTYDPGIFIKLCKLCLFFKPHIIHSWNPMTTAYSLPIAKLFKIKFINAMIVDAPSKLSWKVNLISKISLPFSDIIQSNSRAGLKAYKVEDRGLVIHNGFNFDRIKNLSQNSELSVPDKNKKIIVGMVASFNKYKDYETLINAANKINQYNADILFVLVGGGEKLDEMKMLAHGNPNIIFTGRQNNIESIINTFDIGVLSTFTEGISNSILEYMALRKPVIATDGGGTKEIVQDGLTGFLVPQKSIEELEAKIVLLANNKKLRHQLGENGKIRIKEHFSIEKMVFKHIDLYNALLNHKN